MQDDSLQNILHDFDQQIPKPFLAGDLAKRVNDRIRRRRTARRSVAAAVILLAIIPITLIRTKPKAVPSVAVPTPSKPVHLTKLDADQWDALVHEQTANSILHLRAERKSQSQKFSRQWINVEIEQRQTAAILLTAADHFAGEAHSPQQAKETYQLIIAFFPQTSYAATASQRLAQRSF